MFPLIYLFVCRLNFIHVVIFSLFCFLNGIATSHSNSNSNPIPIRVGNRSFASIFFWPVVVIWKWICFYSSAHWGHNVSLTSFRRCFADRTTISPQFFVSLFKTLYFHRVRPYQTAAENIKRAEFLRDQSLVHFYSICNCSHLAKLLRNPRYNTITTPMTLHSTYLSPPTTWPLWTH